VPRFSSPTTDPSIYSDHAVSQSQGSPQRHRQDILCSVDFRSRVSTESIFVSLHGKAEKIQHKLHIQLHGFPASGTFFLVTGKKGRDLRNGKVGNQHLK
jgi:hypothetical protein